jgi:hypothetical protein
MKQKVNPATLSTRSIVFSGSSATVIAKVACAGCSLGAQRHPLTRLSHPAHCEAHCEVGCRLIETTHVNGQRLISFRTSRFVLILRNLERSVQAGLPRRTESRQSVLARCPECGHRKVHWVDKKKPRSRHFRSRGCRRCKAKCSEILSR